MEEKVGLISGRDTKSSRSKAELKKLLLFPSLKIQAPPFIGTPGFDLVRSPMIAAPLLRNFNDHSPAPTTISLPARPSYFNFVSTAAPVTLHPPIRAFHFNLLSPTSPTIPPLTTTASYYYPTRSGHSSSFNTDYTPTTARSSTPMSSYSPATLSPTLHPISTTPSSESVSSTLKSNVDNLLE